jgi:hypothetical protein
MADHQNWEVREGSEKDIEGILSLREIAFGETEKDRKDPRFWNWQYLRGPEGKAFLYIVCEGERVIGHLADHPRQFFMYGKSVPGAFHLELMVHPDYWRKGIFNEMEQYSIQRMKHEKKWFMTACTVRKESVNGLKKVGWKTVAKLPVMVYPMHFQGIVNRYLPVPSLSFLFGGVLKFFYSLFIRRKKTKVDKKIEVEALTQLDHRYDSFWNKAASLFPVMGARDRTFMDWRYLQHPTRRYLLYRAMKEGEMKGYIVLRKVDLLSFNCLVIVDLLALDEAILPVLVERGVECGKRHGVDLLGMILPKEHSYYKILRQRGFLSSFKVFFFMIYPHSEKPFLLSPENWYVNWGDTDVI